MKQKKRTQSCVNIFHFHAECKLTTDSSFRSFFISPSIWQQAKLSIN